jgi:hypothetical protein
MCHSLSVPLDRHPVESPALDSIFVSLPVLKTDKKDEKRAESDTKTKSDTKLLGPGAGLAMAREPPLDRDPGRIVFAVDYAI